MKKLLDILSLFRHTFKAAKYVRGVDKDGTDCKKGGDCFGAQVFDPATFEASLSNALFLRYCKFAHFSDSVPEMRIASFGESCVCHRALFGHSSDGNVDTVDGGFLNDYARRQVLKQHFGDGTSKCPLAGKMAPELADGIIFDILREAWQSVQVMMIIGDEWLHDLPMNAAQTKVLSTDMAEFTVLIYV